MTLLSKPLLITALASLTAGSASATILAYDGFATDGTGSGDHYLDGETLGSFLGTTGQDFNGIDKTRPGFTGGWGQVDSPMSSSVNLQAVTGGLTYPGFANGDAGTGNPFRTNTPSPQNSDKWIGRELTVTASQISGGYYIAALVDFNGTDGGGFGWAIPGRDNYVEYNGTQATFTSGGSTGGTADFTPQVGTNLIVIEYTTETGGSNPNFYNRWNLWVNPDLSGGDLGTVTATGFGIGRLNNTVVQDMAYAFLSSSNLSENSMFVDEFYIATDPSDFIIPEPGTYALIAGVAAMSLLFLRRRSSTPDRAS